MCTLLLLSRERGTGRSLLPRPVYCNRRRNTTSDCGALCHAACTYALADRRCSNAVALAPSHGKQRDTTALHSQHRLTASSRMEQLWNEPG